MTNPRGRPEEAPPSTPMVGDHALLLVCFVPPSRQSSAVPNRCLELFSRHLRLKSNRWNAKNGFWMSCMGSPSLPFTMTFVYGRFLVHQSDFPSNLVPVRSQGSFGEGGNFGLFGHLFLLFLTARLKFYAGQWLAIITTDPGTVRQFTIVTRKGTRRPPTLVSAW